jgi:small subunit ribosomal protein S5
MAKRNEEFKNDDVMTSEFDESIISINRCSKVVKGGRNFSFGALVVVGNRSGKIGYGYGKANEVSDAIRKGGEIARKNVIDIPLHGSTIPHEVQTRFGGAKILLRPASTGTGLIAGGAVRAILDLAGVNDVLAKSLGSNNPVNVAKATFQAIESLSSREQIMAKRGLSK